MSSELSRPFSANVHLANFSTFSSENSASAKFVKRKDKRARFFNE